MTTAETAEALVAWVREAIPEINSGAPYPGAEAGALPDVWAVVQTVRTVPGDPENFPGFALEAIWLQEWFVEISIMVEQGAGAGAGGAVHETLEGYADTLIGSAWADTTLGDRVQMISPRIEANLAEPFGKRPDGTRGREVVLNVVVAQAVKVPA